MSGVLFIVMISVGCCEFASRAGARRFDPAALDPTPLRRLVNGRDADEQVNRSAQGRHIAEERRDEIESRHADQSPVQTADNEEHGGYNIELLHGLRLRFVNAEALLPRLSNLCPSKMASE
jgi:hypothetical protein